MNSISIVVHVFKGNQGCRLAFLYVNTLLDLIASNLQNFDLFVYCYGYEQGEQNKVRECWADLSAKCGNISLFCLPEVQSETPTIRKVVELAKNLGSKDYILYLHSKGASYKDQSKYISWSMHSIAALAAAINHLFLDPRLADRYSAFGAFAAIGVLERYGSMVPHYSGNFWLAKASLFAKKNVGTRWYTDMAHNRHFAEGVLGLGEEAKSLYNLDDNYNMRSRTRVRPSLVYVRIQKELADVSKATVGELDSIDACVYSYYSRLVDQHSVYCSSRFHWGLRRFLFGNQSQIRRIPFLSDMIDRIVPWQTTELYRHYNGPKQYDILNSLRVNCATD